MDDNADDAFLFDGMPSSHRQQRNYDCRQSYRLTKRLEDHENFRCQHQLPVDAQIICVVKKGVHGAMKPYSYGCLAFEDAQTGRLIFCACFIPLDTLYAEILQKYNHLVSTVYHHGLAQNIVTKNKAAKMIWKITKVVRCLRVRT